MLCCFKKCTVGELNSKSARVEIKTVMPEKRKKSDDAAFKIKWHPDGEAVFHKVCWDIIVKLVKRKGTELMSKQEKAMVKEALKTSEQFDEFNDIVSKAKTVSQKLKTSKHCVVFTGAGISTSAGIGDYRGKSGKWTEMDQETSSLRLNNSNKEDSEPISKRRKLSAQSDVSATTSNCIEKEQEEDSDSDSGDGVPYESLRPTYTHEAIVKLMELGYIKYVISQNGDGLHTLSGVKDEQISEVHGNVFKEKCEKCSKVYHRKFYTMDDVCSQYYEEKEDLGKTTIVKPKHAKACDTCGLSHRTGRKCTKKGCGGHLIDSIINFGDMLDEEIRDRAENHAVKCDLMVCLGSTLSVTPANELIFMGKEPLKVVICNRQETEMDDLCLVKKNKEQLGCRVFGDCDIFFRQLMRNMMDVTKLNKWEEERSKRMENYNKQRD